MKKISKSIKLITLAVVLALISTVFVKLDSKAYDNVQITGVHQIEAGADYVTIEWTAMPGTNYKYTVEMSFDKVNWGKVGVPSKDSSMKIKSNLNPGQVFYVRVSAEELEKGKVINTIAASDPVAVCTTPALDKAYKINQTEATDNSVSATWPSVKGATEYRVLLGDVEYWTKSTSIKVSKLVADSKYLIKVYPVISVGDYKAYSSYESLYLYTAVAGKQIDFSLNRWEWGKNTFELKMTRKTGNTAAINGYQVALYNAKGKLLKQYETSTNTIKIKNKKIVNSAIKVKIRAFSLYSNKKCYGSWTQTKVFVPQPKLYGQAIGNRKYKLKWTKIKGATKYTVYKIAGGNLSKIGATKKNYFVVSNPTTTYYIVKANNVKVGKKKYKTTLADYRNILMVNALYR